MAKVGVLMRTVGLTFSPVFMLVAAGCGGGQETMRQSTGPLPASVTVAAGQTGSSTTIGMSVSAVLNAATKEARLNAEVQPAGAALERLFLDVVEPDIEMLEVPANTPEIAVSGKTLADATVSVNGLLVVPDTNGDFQTRIPLDDGITLIEVVASDRTGTEIGVQRVISKE